jgi:hypothetical protein
MSAVGRLAPHPGRMASTPRNLVLLTACLAGCGGDDGNGSMDTDPGTSSSATEGMTSPTTTASSTGTTADPDGSTSTGDEDPTTNGNTVGESSSGEPIEAVSFLVVDRQGEPLEGAEVAIGTADGVTEGSTDAEGRVRFEGVMPATVEYVIAWREGHRFTADYRVSTGMQPDYPIEVQSLEATPPELVTVSGSIFGKAEPGNTVVISSTRGPLQNIVFSFDDSYQIGVPPEQAFSLVAVELDDSTFAYTERGYTQDLHGWTVASSDGVDEPAEIDLDFDTPTTPSIYAGYFTTPEDPLLLAEGYPNSNVVNPGGSALIGLPTYFDIADTGDRYNLEMEWLDLPGEPARTILEVATYDEREISTFQLVDGLPALRHSSTFLPPAYPTAETFAIDETIAWPAIDGHEQAQLHVYGDEVPIGTVIVPGNATEVTIPALPSAAEPAVVFAGALHGAISTCAEELEDEQRPCRMHSRGPNFALTLPR